jgi:hypothetical protein
MSEGNDRYQLRSVVDVSIPRGRPWLLNEEQYQILHAGDPGDLKAWLFLCIGLLAGAVEGIFSTIQGVEWETAWTQHHEMPFVHLLVQIFVAATALAGLGISGVMLRKRKSLCSDLKARINDHFSSAPVSPAQSPEATEPEVSADTGLVQKS